MSQSNRLIAERRARRRHRQRARRPAARARRSRSVSVNLAESPLGWLFARGHLTRRQFDAGEQLRRDWERAAARARGDDALGRCAVGRAQRPRRARPARRAQIDAKRRFEAAVASAGPGLTDILWRIVCAGEGMRDAETALGWPARAGKVVLCLALDRVADHYRIR